MGYFFHSSINSQLLGNFINNYYKVITLIWNLRSNWSSLRHRLNLLCLWRCSEQAPVIGCCSGTSEIFA
jgi:hypothetical protein